MIQEAIQQLLPESALMTLETMFFAAPEAISEDPKRPEGELISASLTFHGSPPGRFGMLVSVRLARTLSANFIGCDEDELFSGQAAGVMSELANMICGAAVSRLESDSHFDLSSPEVVSIGADESGPAFTAAAMSACRFEFSEGALVAFLAFGESS